MILPHHGKWPQIHEMAFIAPSVDLIGEVEVGSHSSIWFQCVVRGDVNSIKIGSRTNVQDHCTLHVTRKTHSLEIGDDVTVGHRVILHGCKVGSGSLIGMGAVLMDGVDLGEQCLVGAGALLTPGKKFAPRSLIVGSPAKTKRALTDEELVYLKKSADNYVKDAEEYRGFLTGPRRLGEHDREWELLQEGDLE